MKKMNLKKINFIFIYKSSSQLTYGSISHDFKCSNILWNIMEAVATEMSFIFNLNPFAIILFIPYF